MLGHDPSDHVREMSTGRIESVERALSILSAFSGQRRRMTLAELAEETGLQPHHVELLGSTPGWLRYRLPRRCLRHGKGPLCIGQKQVWFLLRLVGEEKDVKLDATESPEFDSWRWVDFWYPLQNVVNFKRGVYHRALLHLAPAAQQLASGSDILDTAPALPDRRDGGHRRPRRKR